MILYLDTSVLVKLVVEERGCAAADALVVTTEYAVSSVIAYAECRSAIARARNTGRVGGAVVSSRAALLRGMDALA